MLISVVLNYSQKTIKNVKLITNLKFNEKLFLKGWSKRHILKPSRTTKLTKRKTLCHSISLANKWTLRTHIEERLAKFDKFQLQLINPHFIIIKQPNSYEVDATIGSPLGDLVAKAENEDLYNAINDLAKKLEAQLIKLKEKKEH